MELALGTIAIILVGMATVRAVVRDGYGRRATSSDYDSRRPSP